MKSSLCVIHLQNYWPVNALGNQKGTADGLYFPPTPKAPGNMQVMFTLMSLITKKQN